jgi:hypothetical protein
MTTMTDKHCACAMCRKAIFCILPLTISLCVVRPILIPIGEFHVTRSENGLFFSKPFVLAVTSKLMRHPTQV